MALTTKRTSALPIPQSELDRMRATLSPMYGAQVWEGAGARILVVRVPRQEPDLVTDIEAAVDYLSPSDTQNLTAALLVGDIKAHVVPVQPFGDLMERRVQFDAQQAQELRRRLSPGTHLTYRAPGDARKTVRLGLRLNCATVEQLSDDELEQWGATLGPELNSGRLNGVRAVYLVAEKDEARLDADLFLQDLKHRLAEAQDRKAMAQQLAAKQSSSSRGAPARPTDSSRGVNYEYASPNAQPEPVLNMRLVGAVEQALRDVGFEVMVAPPVPHAIDVAGERDEGDVQRVIVRIPDRLTIDVAREVLATCRAVDTDLALIVCSDAEPDARKRLIATKVRWVHPDDLNHLRL